MSQITAKAKDGNTITYGLDRVTGFFATKWIKGVPSENLCTSGACIIPERFDWDEVGQVEIVEYLESELELDEPTTMRLARIALDLDPGDLALN